MRIREQLRSLFIVYPANSLCGIAFPGRALLDFPPFHLESTLQVSRPRKTKAKRCTTLVTRGGYAKLEKKLRKSRADALGLESPDLAPAPARYELWKAALTKFDGNMTSSSAALISQRIFTRPQKQPIHDTVIHEDDDMAEAEDDPLSKLMTKLPRLKKAPLELYLDLRVFGVPQHVPVYITFSDALEYNQQLDSWECGFYVMCWIKTIIRVVITDDWNERFKSTSPIPEDTIKQIRQEWTAYLLQRWS
ncbi:hypothetical protein LR48_Vigan01g099300 [Vigna angularis]|uniref:Ubiquitin-like protease family profile domain-containing protein n=1 Tax=Phaseolus angularis TaxID=3914 RepID=A0A0L9TLJ7_PHAAN|nr:hypothetical protein LR48_Vigan01g099300 [Vigna angularis]